MKSGRKLLEEAFLEALPGWQVRSTAIPLDSVRKPGAIWLYTGVRKRVELNGFSTLVDEITVWVLSAADPSKAEDDLDKLLLEVMEVLETLPSFNWESAERGVLGEKYDGWKLTVTCFYKINDEGN
ncbi:MAG: hypothetical protein IPL41_01420 [Micropruina sp.]|nr:hypothetical protein [Micropruina sp.]